MRYSGRDTRYASLTATAEGLRLESTYDPDLVAALKRAVPGDCRTFSKEGGPHWTIDARYGRVVADLCRDALGVNVAVPPALATAPKTETTILRIEYLGACRIREDGTSTATAYCNGQWSVIFPEAALRTWFRAGIDPDGGESRERPGGSDYYALLGCDQAATLAEIRSAYRRLALQWHPDKCREPDAATIFKQIAAAYQVLTDPPTRKKYDVGLRVQALCPPPARPANGESRFGYRPLLRCGWVRAEGRRKVGRLIVSSILQWEDIVNDHGQVMVSSWPQGGESFVVEWRDPDDLL